MTLASVCVWVCVVRYLLRVAACSSDDFGKLLHIRRFDIHDVERRVAEYALSYVSLDEIRLDEIQLDEIRSDELNMHCFALARIRLA